MFSNYKNKENDKGFSIMEVIISVGIVSFAFVGIMSVFASNVRVEIANRDKITAAYLVQEGMEVIKQTRDNNWFAGDSWDTDLSNNVNQTIVLNNPDSISQGWDIIQASASEELCRRNIYLSDNGTYVQSGSCNSSLPAAWKATKFKRIIGIEKLTAEQMRVTVTVSYGANSVRAISYLYDTWYTN